MTINQNLELGKSKLFHIVLAPILSFVGVAACLKSVAFENYYFSSDNLYMLNYFYSLKEKALSSFQYSHLPNLFPEGAISLSLLAAHVPWQVVYLFYSATMFLILTLSVRKLYDSAAPASSPESFYLFVIFSVALFLLPSPNLLQVLVAGVHGGSFVVSVFAAVLAWRFLSGVSQRSLTILSSLALITVAATFSDLLFLIEFVVPLAVVSSAMAFFRLVSLRKSLTINLVVSGPAIAGALLLHLLPTSPFPPSSPGVLLHNTLRFFTSVPTNEFIASLLVFTAMLVYFAACLRFPSSLTLVVGRLCGTLIADQSKAPAWLFFWAFGLVVSLAGLMMTIISYSDFGSYRYAISFFWWPLILGLTLAAMPASRFQLLLPTVAVLGVTVLSFVAALRPTPEFWATKLARCLEEKGSLFSLHAGLAEYWTAHPVTELSQRKVIVSQVTENGDPYLWINNRLDYFTDNKERNLRNYDFIILNKLDREQVGSKFGTPSHIFKCGTYDIVQYEDTSIIRSILIRWFEEHK